MKNETHKEMKEGTNGSGNTVYLVITINENGTYKHIETFTNKTEAKHWMKWA